MTGDDDTPTGCNCHKPDVYGHNRNCPHHKQGVGL